MIYAVPIGANVHHSCPECGKVHIPEISESTGNSELLKEIQDGSSRKAEASQEG